MAEENRVYFWAGEVSGISTSANSMGAEVAELNFALKLKSQRALFANVALLGYKGVTEYNTTKQKLNFGEIGIKLHTTFETNFQV